MEAIDPKKIFVHHLETVLESHMELFSHLHLPFLDHEYLLFHNGDQIGFIINSGLKAVQGLWDLFSQNGLKIRRILYAVYLSDLRAFGLLFISSLVTFLFGGRRVCFTFKNQMFYLI